MQIPNSKPCNTPKTEMDSNFADMDLNDIRNTADPGHKKLNRKQ